MRVWTMKKWLFALSVAVLALSISDPSDAAETPNTAPEKKSVFIASFFYPPLLVGEDEAESGLYVELARFLFSAEGYSVKHRNFAFMRAMQGTESCEYDAIGAINRFNSQKILLSRSIPLKLKFSFWVKKGNPWTYRGLESLSSVKVAHVPGYNYSQASAEYQKYLEANPERVYPVPGENTTQRIFQMILADRPDVNTFNIDFPQAVWTMKKMGAEGKLVSAGSLPNVLEGAVGFCPGERGEKLRKVFDESFRKRIGDPQARAIYAKYGLETEWEEAKKSVRKSGKP